MVLSCGFLPEQSASVCIVFDKMDKIGLDGVKTELLEKGFDTSAVEKFLSLLNNPQFGTLDFAKTYASDENTVNELCEIINTSNELSKGLYSIEFDPSLVRGQGYYTGPVFEISCGQYASSVGGGGRYDKMVGREVGEDVPAVGFSIGFERICDVLSEHPEIFNPNADLKKIALVYGDTDNFVSVMQKAEELRSEGFWVNIQKRGKKLGKQLDALVDNGYGYCWLLGESTEPKILTKK